MGHSVFWHIPQRVYIVHVFGKISVEELGEISSESVALIRAGEPPVHGIIDMRHMNGFPGNLREIRNTTSVLQEPGLQWVILVSEDPVLNFMANILTQLSPVKHKVVQQPADALAILAKADDTLSPMPEYPESTPSA